MISCGFCSPHSRAKWNVDSRLTVQWQSSHTTWTSSAPGNHSVCFVGWLESWDTTGVDHKHEPTCLFAACHPVWKGELQHLEDKKPSSNKKSFSHIQPNFLSENRWDKSPHLLGWNQPSPSTQRLHRRCHPSPKARCGYLGVPWAGFLSGWGTWAEFIGFYWHMSHMSVISCNWW